MLAESEDSFLEVVVVPWKRCHFRAVEGNEVGTLLFREILNNFLSFLLHSYL